MQGGWPIGVISVLLGLGMPSLALEAAMVPLVPQRLAQTRTESRFEAERLLNACREQLRQEQAEAVIVACQAAVQSHQQIGDRGGEAKATVNLGIAYEQAGQYDAALSTLQLGLTLAQEVGDHRVTAIAWQHLGDTYAALGQPQQAAEFHQKAQRFFEQTAAADQLNQQGIQQARVSQFREALQSWEQALEIYRAIQDKLGEANALGNLGIVYRELGDYPRAIEFHQQSLAIKREIGNRLGESNTLGNLGNVYNTFGDYPRAIEFYQQSLAISREIGNRLSEASSLGNLGTAYYSLSDYPRAIEFHQQSLAIKREIGDRLGESQSLGNLGIAYYSLSDYPRAIEFHQQSLAISREIGNRRGEAAALVNLGLAYNDLGDYPRAIEFHQQSLAIKREIGDRRGESNALGNLGLAYNDLGDYPRAIEFHQQSLAIKREIGDRRGESNALGNLGLAYNDLGDYPRAIEFHQQSLAIKREIGDRRGESNALGNLGLAYNDLGDYPRAIEFHQQSLAIKREIGDRRGESNALGNLGLAYNDLGDYPRAIEFHQQHLAISREIGNRRGEANSLGNLGNAYDALGDYPRAIEFYQQTLAIFRGIKDEANEGRTLSNLAFTLDRMGQPELAIILFKQSVNVREGIRSRNRTLSTDLQESYTQTVAGSYRKLADLLIEQGRIAEAQQVLELLKLEELNEFSRGLRSPKSLAQVKLNAAEEKIKAEHASLIAFGSTFYDCERNTCAELDTLRRQYQSLSTAFLDLVQEIVQTQKQNRRTQVARGTDDFLASRESVVTAQPDSILIYPLVLDDKVRLLWAAKGGVLGNAVCNLDQASLNQLVTRFQDVITQRQDITQVQATGKDLYDCLVKPLEPELQANNIRNLIFVPDRVTNYIPMGALFDGEQFLIQRYTVTNILAASVTDTTDRLPATPTQVPTLGLGLSEAKAGFNALRHVPEELDAIVRQPQADDRGVYPGQVFQNGDFTRQALETNLRSHRILHIATHAEFVPATPHSSYFLLGTGTKYPIPQIRTLRNLKTVHLVVLSACETAKGGPDHTGIEVAGISSFFTGGQDKAKAVMASLWKVNDASTSDLMQRFYQYLATGQMTKAAALQKAQTDLLNGQSSAESSSRRGSVDWNPGAGGQTVGIGGDRSHPYYWAPFVLIGNGL